MRKADCFYLGKIAKKFSFKGEVLVYLDTDEPEDYEDLESVFVDFHKNLVPFFIENAALHKNNFLRVKFEEVDSEADADEIIGRDIYLPLSMLPPLEGNKFYYHEVISFTIIDQNIGEVGKITAINDTTAQPLFEVEQDGRDFFIPMIDQFIIEVDRKNKKIIMNLPEGITQM